MNKVSTVISWIAWILTFETFIKNNKNILKNQNVEKQVIKAWQPATQKVKKNKHTLCVLSKKKAERVDFKVQALIFKRLIFTSFNDLSKNKF